MPWSKQNLPKVALNWTPDEQGKCISAANAALAKGASDRDAIFACIGAAGKSESMADFVPIKRTCQNCALLTECTMPGEPCDKWKLKLGSAPVPDYQALKQRERDIIMSEQFLIPFSKALRDDILIFPVGKFYRDGGERTFTKEMGAQMVKNFKDNILERKNDGWLPVNGEHMRQYGKLAYLVALYQDEDGNVRGKPHDPENKLGGFDYFSPEVRWAWVHPTTNKEYKTVLMGGGATNYPFFLGKMALQDDEVAVAKSADLPLVWSGSEWETFSMGESEGVRGKIMHLLGVIMGLIMGEGEQEEPEVEDEMSEPGPIEFVHTVEFAATDDARRIMTGVVWEPDTLDMHDHAVTAEDIEAGAHDFMSRLQLDAHHDRLIQSDEVRIVESWIQREPITWKMTLPDGGVRTTEVKPGSWCMSVQVLNDELWSEVQSGDITGFSPVGQAIAQQIT